MLVIHRPGQPDEIISSTAFRRRALEAEEQEGDTQTAGSDAAHVDHR